MLDVVERYVAELEEKFGYVNCRELAALDVKTNEGFREYSAKFTIVLAWIEYVSR